MNILFLSQYYPPDITAAANRVGETVQILSERGNSVCVVTSTPHKSKKHGEIKINKEFQVHRIPVEAIEEKTFLSYIKQYFGFSFGAFVMALKVRKTFKFDIILVTSPPLPIVLTSILLKIISRKPVVLDVRDVWPESAVSINKIRKGSVSEKLGKILEWAAYKHATAITCVSRDMGNYINDKCGYSKSTIVYNGVLSEGISTISSYYGDPDIFCYAGNLGYAQDLKTLFIAFANSTKHKSMKNSRLVIIGGGAMLDELKALSVDLCIEKRVEFLGELEKTNAMHVMSKAGVLLVPIMSSSAFDLTVPSKIFDCLSLGRPIISSVSGEGREILQSTGANIVVESGSVDKLSEAFILMRENWNARSKCSTKNIKLVSSEFTREVAVDTLIGVLKKCCLGSKNNEAR